MNKPTLNTIKAVAGGAIVGFAIAAGVDYFRPPQPPAPATPVVFVPADAGKQQARDALMALPELKVWSDRIEKNSGGKVRGALAEFDPTPKLVNGKKYWQLSFVENGAVAAHSWDSFLVEVGGSTILVEDFNTDTQLTLDQWRATKHPMARTKAETEG